MNKEEILIKPIEENTLLCEFKPNGDILFNVSGIRTKLRELEEKVNQLETNRDNAIRFIKICSFIEQHKEDVIEILERGKE